jgi:hypothetical protein
MRTSRLVLPFTHASAQDRRAFDRRIKQASAMIGSILAVGVVAMALAGAFPGRPGHTVAHDTVGSAVNAGEDRLERSGTLSELEILW